MGRIFTTRRILKGSLFAHAATCGFAVFIAATAADRQLENDERNAKVAVLNGGTVLKRMLSDKWLSEDERACVHAYTNVMSFRIASPKAFAAFAPNVKLCDTLISFSGLSEFRDGWWFLSFFFDSAIPSPYSIKHYQRERDNTTVVFVKYNTTYRLRLVPFEYSIPSSARLEIRDVHGEKKISAIHHRWFNGPILGRMSYSGVVGDAGYLFRRFNGFVLSSIVTAQSEYVSVAARSLVPSSSEDNNNNAK